MSIIIKPIISEKMTQTAEKYNRYGFMVTREATKPEIKREVEAVYGVKVVRVNTLIQRGKVQNRNTKAGVITGQKNNFKKAYVFVDKDQKIDFYSNI
ncbi:MAG: 50S ribosomal protein L23 [Bacteroidales bacterium]|jgi:large subunit ribosomal protein L23|nr:50S ribosomal protein L23 [Bacteroidales bacterium]MBR3572634.1 50S ribosomal protein L23 [Bacteroidales bacterium]